MENEQILNKRQLLKNIAADVRLFAEGCGLIYIGTLREESKRKPEEQFKPPMKLEDPINATLVILGLVTTSIAIGRRLPEESGTRKAN